MAPNYVPMFKPKLGALGFVCRVCGNDVTQLKKHLHQAHRDRKVVETPAGVDDPNVEFILVSGHIYVPEVYIRFS